jgi:hypothetical protein
MSVGWIDFSSEHRDKVRTVIDLLKQQGVVDELGIGVVRDAFADRLFPGVSTIQTRAKYFILTALLIRDYEQLPDLKRKSQSLEEYLRKREQDCRIKLAERYGEQGKTRGIIGISFGLRRDRDIQRPPSSVYWNGLRTFGIARSRLSLSEFGRELGGRRSLKSVLEGTERLKGDDHDADADAGPKVRILKVDANYWNDLTITLTREEAEFLRHQITVSVLNSLLGQILLDGGATAELVKLKSNDFADMAELPFVRRLKREDLKKTIYHARDFWKILDGAHILYNRLLRSRFGSKLGVQECDELWEAWLEAMQELDWSSWDNDFVWQLVEQHGSTVRRETKDFVNGWIQQARKGKVDRKDCDELVTKQERANKLGRARLRPNAKGVEIDGWVGLKVLDYRLPQVKTLVQDIQRGESEEADPDAGY